MADDIGDVTVDRDALLTDVADTLHTPNALHGRLEAALQFHAGGQSVDASIGVFRLAHGEQPDTTLDELLRAADEAMYHHKTGRHHRTERPPSPRSSCI